MYLFRRHIARVLGIHPLTVDRYCREGKLILRESPVNKTKKRYVTREELEDMNSKFMEDGHWSYKEFEERQNGSQN